jgi:hypothetical protein
MIMKISPHRLVLILCICFLLFIGCEKILKDPLAGGTESGNPTRTIIKGIIADSSGVARAGVMVKILPELYNPVTGSIPQDSLADLTDSQGRYQILITTTGLYKMVGVDPQDGSSVLQDYIAVEDSGDLDLGQEVLLRPGAINAEIPQSKFVNNGYLYIPGTEIQAAVSSHGMKLLSSVPEGIVDLIYYSSTDEKAINLGDNYSGIQVFSSDTVTVQSIIAKR